MPKNQSNASLEAGMGDMPNALYADPLLNGEYVGVELLPPNAACDFPPTDASAGNHGPAHIPPSDQPNVEWGGTVNHSARRGSDPYAGKGSF